MLHEWDYQKEEEPRTSVNDLGEVFLSKKELVSNLVTWVYEERTFVPSAKIVANETFSIISDYIGRPVQAYNENGSVIWETDYDIYGRLRNLQGEKAFIPFRQLGQYEDEELGGLYYNRFRYYDCNIGGYISQDPIGLEGNNPNFYAYTYDSNSWVDVYGLSGILNQIPSFQGWQRHHIIPKSLGGYGKTGYIHEAIKLSGIDVDGTSRNILQLPMFDWVDAERSIHKGWSVEHADYNKMVKSKLDDILKEGKKLNAGDLFYKNKVTDLMDELRGGLMTRRIKCG